MRMAGIKHENAWLAVQSLVFYLKDVGKLSAIRNSRIASSCSSTKGT